MTVGQLQHLVHLLALGALTEKDPRKRIAMVKLADELARKEEAVARWRGHSVHDFALPQAVRDGLLAFMQSAASERRAA